MLTEKRESQLHRFETNQAYGAQLDALLISQFYAYRDSALDKTVIDENNRSIEFQLASLGFYDLKKNCPTYAGLIAFGANPRLYLPGNYVQYLRFSGSGMDEKPIDQKEVSGDLLFVLRELDILISASITTSLINITPMQEKQVYDYPIVAIRELIYNAVMHRDYESNAPIRFYWFSDRIEIQNPGGLYGNVELGSLGTINDYRNPTIADVMKTLGYVNKFGYGIQRAKAELSKNENPPAEFSTPSGNKVFKVVIKKRAL
ncbi:MAG: ATP-binding protein [Desulfuromonadaceae bacterium]|jgi:ATP-dependent DNA helicase RecG|nr:ATP-binding protein [Desulfuromonadaceae bacterium]